MGVSWLSKGEQSKQLAQQEVVQQEIKKQEQGKLFKFFLGINEQGVSITFVDGELDKDGFLVPPRYYEHNLFLNGKWGNTFVCPQMTAPHLGYTCPICATPGQKSPSLVSLFTVIDHRKYESKQTPGKIYQNTRKLFIAKSGTMELLNHIALKRGGLAGCRFDVMRIGAGDKLPSVGTNFDFMEKTPIEELKKQYMVEVVDPQTNQKKVQTLFVPADYDNEITFHTGEQLAALGLGTPKVSGFSGQQVKTEFDQPATDYDSQL